MPHTITVEVPVSSARKFSREGEHEDVTSAIEAALAAHESATEVTARTDKSAQQQLDTVLRLLNIHLRRYPHTKSNLANSLEKFFSFNGRGQYLLHAANRNPGQAPTSVTRPGRG